MQPRIMELMLDFQRTTGREPKYLICGRDAYRKLMIAAELICSMGPSSNIFECIGLIVTIRTDDETDFMDVA